MHVHFPSNSYHPSFSSDNLLASLSLHASPTYPWSFPQTARSCTARTVFQLPRMQVPPQASVPKLKTQLSWGETRFRNELENLKMTIPRAIYHKMVCAVYFKCRNNVSSIFELGRELFSEAENEMESCVVLIYGGGVVGADGGEDQFPRMEW